MTRDSNNRSKIDLSNVVPWKNTEGTAVPAYGVVQLRTNLTGGISQASKPDAGDGLFFVNGPVPVASTKRGESHLWNKPQTVLICGSPSVGDEVGPVDGQWHMSVDGAGYRVLLQPTNGVGVVDRFGGVTRVQVVMKEDLYAAGNYKNDPSYADAVVLRRKSNGDLARTTTVIQVVNRFENLSVDAGTYAKAELIDGEWQLYAADCPGGSSSESSGEVLSC